MTASLGVACLGGHVQEPADLVAAADAAPSTAKRLGKDCVVVAGGVDDPVSIDAPRAA